jgi:hypothetical protein
MTTTPEVIAWLNSQLETVKGRTLVTELRYAFNSLGSHTLSGWLRTNEQHPAWCCGAGLTLNDALADLNRDAAQRQKLISDMMPLDEAQPEALHD